MAAPIFDIYVAYSFIRLLTTDWTDMPAYKLGIIDERGKILKKSGSLTTAEEKRAYNIFHRLAFNIKKLIEKLPFGKTRLGSFAAGLFLLKEHLRSEGYNPELLEEKFVEFIKPRLSTQEADSIYEHQQYNSGKIGKGQYTLNNNTVVIQEDLEPIGDCLGFMIYNVDGIYCTEYDMERRNG